MTVTQRRLGRLFGATTALLTLATTIASSASASPSPPPCQAGALPGHNPADACLHTSYSFDSYTTQLVRAGGISVTHKTVGKGQFAYVLVTVKTGFTLALQECPAGGSVPYAAIPCQMGSANMQIVGRYVSGQKHLVTTTAVTPYGTTCQQNVTAGTCTLNFRLYPNQAHGYLVNVIQVQDGQITNNPANDLTLSGFEFSVGVTVPKPPKLKGVG